MGTIDHRDDALLATDLHVEATYRLTEALVEAETRMRRRVELLAEIVFETDAQGRLVFLNGAWRCALGREPDACLGRGLQEFVDPADWPACAQAIAAATPTTPQMGTLIRMRGEDGTVNWMELSVRQIASGGAVGALHNVTEHKRAQDELAKLSLVASSTDNMVVITDREGRTEWVNQAFTRKTGWELAEIAGRTPGEVLQGPETDASTVRQIGRWIRQGRSFEAELLNYTRWREPYWVKFQITPIHDDRGDVVRFVSIQTDATEMRRTQQELEAARRRAEAANDAKTLFLATISHEMRTPLNAILGSTDLALDGDADVLRLREHLERINGSAEALLHLISDILDVSKIEAGQIEIERIPVRLESCLREALAPIADRARAKGLDFGVEWDGRLPEVVLGDPGRMRQIVTNLAENAVKFTERGFVRIEVGRSDAALGGCPAIQLRVIDSGLGIAADAQSRMFEHFVQGDSSTTRRTGGAGLGLSIVRSVVEALGGHISVFSRAGEGADFRVAIPLLSLPDAVDGPRSAPAPAGSAPRTAPRAGASVLVAEDNDVNFAVLKAYLDTAGYIVERAANGREAVCAAPCVDLVLMDLEMPEMDGLAATRQIRLDEAVRGVPPVPVIAVTAHALQEYRDRSLAAGCTGYIAKPVRMAPLLDVVAAALAAAT